LITREAEGAAQIIRFFGGVIDDDLAGFLEFLPAAES